MGNLLLTSPYKGEDWVRFQDYGIKRDLDEQREFESIVKS
jgi:hypothetical protein